MTSLSKVYEGGVRTVVDRRQRWLGMTLFAVGASMVVAAITVATTDLSAWFGFDVIKARWHAGVLAGVGLPAAFVGIFVVLPASGATRAAAAIGASLAMFGVVLFAYAYPQRWLSNDPTFALGTIVLYSVGTLLTFWCLFVAIATFKTRNDPGGTARIEITEEGKVRVINAGPADPGPEPKPSGSRPSIPGFGSVGLFGNDPDGSVPTQTNATGSTASSSSPPERTDDGIVMTEPASDGGTAITGDGGDSAVTGDNQADVSGPDAEILDAAEERGQPDRYCGNCTHFEYVQVDGEIEPYCGLYADLMDDMDACREWEERESGSLPR
jgi:hypothetical protein